MPSLRERRLQRRQQNKLLVAGAGLGVAALGGLGYMAGRFSQPFPPQALLNEIGRLQTELFRRQDQEQEIRRLEGEFQDQEQEIRRLEGEFQDQEQEIRRLEREVSRMRANEQGLLMKENQANQRVYSAYILILLYQVLFYNSSELSQEDKITKIQELKRKIIKLANHLKTLYPRQQARRIKQLATFLEEVILAKDSKAFLETLHMFEQDLAEQHNLLPLARFEVKVEEVNPQPYTKESERPFRSFEEIDPEETSPRGFSRLWPVVAR